VKESLKFQISFFVSFGTARISLVCLPD
jgi:hypothetical protein